MALAETARLVTQLTLDDRLSPGLSKAQSGLSRFDRTVTGSGNNLTRLATGGARSMGILGHAISTALGVGLERVVAGGLSAAKNAIAAGIDGANRLEAANAQTVAGLKSTRDASGQTVSSIRKLAESYEALNATIDDKVIQAGENLLLTFPKIRKDAFEPALLAALNLNTALGGGEGGLQGTIIQVGKALQDPIRGLTTLRRVGVGFTADQEKQIKALVKAGDLYGAQKIILGEIATEYGGRFAAEGKTAAATQKALRDSVEDLEITFAQGLLPGLQNVRLGLIKTFRDPNTQRAVADLGTKLGSLLSKENIDKGIGFLKSTFTTIRDVVASIPWGTIGGALKIAGQISKTAIDAFLALPKEVQGIAIAFLAGNKLSGGLLGSAAGSLGGKAIGLAIDLFKGRGTTPANPLYVADVTGGGGGGPSVPPGGGGAPNPTQPLSWAQRLLSWLPGLALAGGQFAEAAAHDEFQRKQELNIVKTLVQKASEKGSAQEAIDYLRQAEQGRGITAGERAGLEDAIRQLTASLPGMTGTGSPATAHGYGQLAGRVPGSAITAGLKGAAEAVAKLSSDQFLSKLRTTAFIGAKDYKSIFERFTTFAGGGRGTDPTGQGFLRLVEQLKNPKDPKVMTEINGHMRELQHLEAYYVAHGDTVNARKTDAVIAKLAELIGITRPQSATQQAVVRAVREGHAVTRRGFQAELDPLNRIAAKKTSVNVNLTATVPVSVYVNATMVNKRINQLRTSTGRGMQAGYE